MAVTNQHILNEIAKLRTEEIKPLREILIGNGDPEKSLCFRVSHIENVHCKNSGKTLLGIPASVRSEGWKWFIRLGNVTVWILIAYLVTWANEHGVEITNILRQLPK